MNSAITMRVVGDLIVLLLFLAALGWVMYRACKKSEDPAKLVFKWIFSLVIVGVIIRVVLPMIMGGGYGAAFGGVPFAAVCGLALAITWRRSIAEMFANPFNSIFDGGSQEVEAHAFYSRAEKLRQRQQFPEAIAEIRKQLEKFPNDFAGQMMLAEINAEHLQDLQSAEIIIHKLVEQPQHSQGQIAGALHALADWHMKLAQDPDSSRLALEKIIERFPDSNFSQTAAQRIAHLGSVDSLLATHDRPTLVLKHFDPYATLQNPSPSAAQVLPDAATQAADCLRQLEKHPFDTEAREKLALIYAHEYQRLDLAADELDQLISQPNQPSKQVVRWLNLLADLQIKVGNNISAANETVLRIQELFPGSAYAEQATLRLEYLRSEARRHEKTE
ncbi:MAG: outer membrane protein assembly factor BamD, partial [Verrucomicrobiota bacterium]